MTDSVVDIDRIKKRGKEFGRINKKAGGSLQFSNEVEFAIAIVNHGGSYIRDAYNNDPERLELTVLSAASLGLSLNPSLGFACIVPRAPRTGQKPVLRFELMYQGLIKLATAEGAVKGLRVGIVHRNDPFVYNQATGVISHTPDPFATVKQRGERMGAYCVALLSDGTEIPHFIGREEINDIKSRVPGLGQGFSPWQGKFTESQMWIKTAIKQASKFWPRTDSESLHFREAVAHDDDEYGSPGEDYATTTQIEELTVLAVGTKGLDKVCRAYGLQTIGTLLAKDFESAKKRLRDYVTQAKPSDKASE